MNNVIFALCFLFFLGSNGSTVYQQQPSAYDYNGISSLTFQVDPKLKLCLKSQKQFQQASCKTRYHISLHLAIVPQEYLDFQFITIPNLLYSSYKNPDYLIYLEMTFLELLLDLITIFTMVTTFLVLDYYFPSSRNSRSKFNGENLNAEDIKGTPIDNREADVNLEGFKITSIIGAESQVSSIEDYVSRSFPKETSKSSQEFDVNSQPKSNSKINSTDAAKSLESSRNVSNSLDQVNRVLLIKDQDPRNIFEDFKNIGQGAFGEVKKAVHKLTKQNCAIKVINTKNKEFNLEGITSEINSMKLLNHQNIIQFIGAYEVDDQIWICMEYMNAGDLFGIIEKKSLKEAEIACVCYDLLLGLNFIHHSGKIHRDLKSENILLNSKGEIKLADLGLCCDNTGYENAIAGTSDFMAPEVVKRQSYDSKIDIWSLGILAIEMADQNTPWIDAKDEYEVLSIIQTLEKSPSVSKKENWSLEFLDFLEKCLDLNPQKRYGACELLKHPFLKKKCQNNFIVQYLNQFNLLK